MRSTVGGVGMPTGEGVTNSPSSPLISAMTPANGARSWVRSSCALRDVDARLGNTGRVLGRRAPAAVESALPSRLFGGFLRREPLVVQLLEALASRLATSAVTQASRARDARPRVAVRELELGFHVVVPELEEHVAFFDAVAVLDGQARDFARRALAKGPRAGRRRRCPRGYSRRWRRPRRGQP